MPVDTSDLAVDHSEQVNICGDGEGLDKNAEDGEECAETESDEALYILNRLCNCASIAQSFSHSLYT
jgi:hypothetical protein